MFNVILPFVLFFVDISHSFFSSQVVDNNRSHRSVLRSDDRFWDLSKEGWVNFTSEFIFLAVDLVISIHGRLSFNPGSVVSGKCRRLHLFRNEALERSRKFWELEQMPYLSESSPCWDLEDNNVSEKPSDPPVYSLTSCRLWGGWVTVLRRSRTDLKPSPCLRPINQFFYLHF